MGEGWPGTPRAPLPASHTPAPRAPGEGDPRPAIARDQRAVKRTAPSSPYCHSRVLVTHGEPPAAPPPGDPTGIGASPGAAQPCPVPGSLPPPPPHRHSQVSLRPKPARPQAAPRPLPRALQPGRAMPRPGKGPRGTPAGLCEARGGAPPPFAPCPPPPAGGFSLASSPRSRRTTEETSGTSSTYGISSKQLRP